MRGSSRRGIRFCCIAEAARTLLGRTALAQTGNQIDVVIKLYSSRTVQLHLFQRLAHDIVGLALGVLDGFDGGGFVDIALVVDVELAKGVAEAVDLGLGELGVFLGG